MNWIQRIIARYFWKRLQKRMPNKIELENRISKLSIVLEELRNEREKNNI